MADVLSPEEMPPVILPTSVAGHVDRDTVVRDVLVVQVGGISPKYRYTFRLDEQLKDILSVSFFSSEDENIVNQDSSPDSLVQAAKILLERVQSCRYSWRSLVFLAHDIGGSIVKMALLLASEDPDYKDIFDGTHLLIFFGAPHRPSKENGWLSPLLSIVESCFYALKGPWLPSVLNQLAIQHEELAPRFASFSARFRIISYYLTQDSPGTHHVALSKHCATLGIEHEECVAIDTQRQYGFLERSDLDRLNRQLLDSRIAHSRDFNNFIQLLSFEEPVETIYSPPLALHVKMAGHLLALPEVTMWLSSRQNPDKILRLRLGKIFHPRSFFDSLTVALRLSRSTRHFHPSTLIIGSNAPNRGPMTEINILSALIRQLLLQQPRLYSKIQNLFPLVHDAVLGKDMKWKQRTLWRSLETLLYSPRDTETFCFVHVGKCAVQAKIIQLLASAAQKTEIPLHIVVSVEDKLDYPHDSDSANFLDFDLLSETFEEPRKQDITSQVDIIGEQQPAVLPARQAIIDKLQTSTDHAHSEVFLKRLQHSITHPSAGCVQRLWADCVKPESRFTMIKRSIEDQGPWVAMALFWILHSLQPMSIEELDVLLAFEESREQESDLHFLTDRASVASLQVLLPGVIDIVDGKTLICQPSPEMKDYFAQVMSNHFPHIKVPSIYMVETCLLFLVDYLSDGYFRMKMSAIDETPKDVLQSGIVRTDRAAQQALSSLAKYTAQHWITHCHLANYQPTLDDKVFSKFAHESTVKGWMEMLMSSFGLGDLSYDEERDNVFRVLNLRGGDKFDLFRVLELCSYASSRPTSTGLLGRLLVLAAELGDEDFLNELCEVNGSFDQEAVVRALAAAPWLISQKLIKKPLMSIGRSNTADIYLTALQLNNSETAQHALTTLKTQGLTSLPDDFVTTAMLIACVFDDEPMASAILNDKELSATLVDESTKDSSKWNPLHVAATKGQVEMISRLLSLEMSIEAKTPKGQSPLMLATMHGLSQLASTLLDKSAIVDSRDSSEQTPLHVASQHGFLTITRLLVSKEADMMAQDDRYDTPLHLAVRNGHSEIAKVLIEAHRSKSTVDADNSIESALAADSEMDDEGNDEYEDEDENEEEESDDGSVAADDWVHYFDKANSEGATVLLEAAGKGLADIAEALVQEGANPTTGDQRSMTPLHYAAKNGATSLVRCLVEHGAAIDVKETGDSFTPLHLACYYGQTEAVEELLKSELDLSILDDWSRTPLVAACSAGERRVVEILKPRYENEDWGNALVVAARYNWNDVVEYLLDSGCSPDAVDNYSNSALHFAAYSENPSLIQLLLLRRCQVDPKDSDSGTPLYDAARVGAHQSVKVLTDAGADMELEVSDGRTPLCAAIYWEKPRTVRLLLAKGAKLILAPYWASSGSSVLEFALRSSSNEVAEIVIEFYAQGKGEDEVTPAKALGLVLQEKPSLLSPLLKAWPGVAESLDEVVDDNAGTALHLLALNGDAGQLKLLLQGVQNASVNIVAGNYGTVLQAAICGGGDKLEKAKLLLECGADPSIRGGLHGTTLNAAAYWQQNEIAKLLLEALRKDGKQCMSVAGDNGQPIEAAVKGSPLASSEESTVELLDLLRENGASLSAVCRYDGTLLHVAAEERSLKVVEWLLENGVSADATDIVGRRPMHLAIHKGDLDMVKRLLTGLTTLATCDNQGRNGLHYATISKVWTMTKDLIELYRQKNEDDSDFVKAIDVNKWAPLHWACRQSDLDIVSYLIEKGADKSAKTKEKWTPWHVAVFHGKTDESYLGLLPEPAPHEKAGLPTEPATCHSAFCDTCFSTIYGIRYQCECETCNNFDLCFKCYENYRNGVKIHYQGHEFKELEE